jgi:NAD(P)-dependent dehydrogenase (short-subunit alcohol dehydrogenase family)
MITRESGSVINIAPMPVFSLKPGLINYEPAKAAVVSMTRIAADEWGPHGVRINAIALASTHRPTLAVDVPDEVHEPTRTTAVPPGRLGLADAIGELVVFLASDAASYITGTCITIDGETISALPGYRHERLGNAD